jgi:hypothetical protein
MVTGGGIRDLLNATPSYWIDPYRHTVVYRADQETDEVVELFSAPVLGGTPAVKVSGPMVAGGDASTVRFAPTLRLVYSADQETNDALELFTSAYDALDAPRPAASAPGPTRSATRGFP